MKTRMASDPLPKPRQLQIKVYKAHGQVILAFGRDVSWIGLLPKQAKEIAEMLLKQARQN